MRRVLIIVVTAVLALGGWVTLSRAQSTPKAPSGEEIAQKLLASPAGRFMTASTRAALEMTAHGDRLLSHDSVSPPDAASARAAAAQTAPAQVHMPTESGLQNVRVNNPGEDTNQTDQTTQSETTIAVSGRNVVVGFNDSQKALLGLTAGAALTGYAYSRDGGNSFTDGGTVPNAPGYINLSDPWAASDRAGNMYFANVVLSPFRFGPDVGVARSTDGGRTWNAPIIASASLGDGPAYIADKDALTVGPDPVNRQRDNVYAVWDDFTFDLQTGTEFSGLPVARSTDGGASYQVTYADKIVLQGPPDFCSFHQFFGNQPVVGPDGTLYVATLRLDRNDPNDPNCSNPVQTVESEWLYVSKDGGKTFAKYKIADVTPGLGPGNPAGVFQLGPGMAMRAAEFPSLALSGSTLYVTWNDGGQGDGHSHIRLARSTDGGQTWTTSWVTPTSSDNQEAQPAVSTDASGVHVLYYRIEDNRMLDVFVSHSKDGSTWSVKRVTSQSFPGVLNLPQFDPLVAFTYMGDYIANVSDGTHQYYAWGDNRDLVKNFMYPQGRNDPNVYFASSSTGEGDHEGDH